MAVSRVLNWPPPADALVDTHSVCPQLRTRFHLTVQKVCSVMALWVSLGHHIPRELSGIFLLPHEQETIFKECLVQLYYVFQNMGFFG
jgi:hypothetical protein